MQLKFSDSVYNVCKWLALIAIPAFSVLYSALSAVWQWPYAGEIAASCNAIVVFLGALIKISTDNYNAEKQEITVS